MATTDAAQRQLQKAMIDEAWARYRLASQQIPNLPYSGSKRAGVYHEGFLEIDERLWRRYLAAEQ